MPTLFDLIGHPAGQSPYDHPDTNLSDAQQVLLHKARSVCQLLVELTDPVADVPVTWNVGHQSIQGVAWLLRDLIDEAAHCEPEGEMQ